MTPITQSTGTASAETRFAVAGSGKEPLHRRTGRSVMVISRERTPVRTRRTTGWLMPSLTGMLVGVLGAVGVILSMFMSWRTGGVHPSDVPAAFLWDRHASGDPSLLVFLIP